MWYQCGFSVGGVLLAAVSGVGALEMEEFAHSVGRSRDSWALEGFRVETTGQVVLDVPGRVSSTASSQRLEGS